MVGQVGLERPKGDRVKHNLDEVIAALDAPVGLNLVQSARAFVDIRGVEIEEQNVPPLGAQGGYDFLDVPQGGPAVKMDSEDVQTAASQFAARSFAEAAG